MAFLYHYKKRPTNTWYQKSAMKKMIETSMRKTIITLLISIAYGMFAYFSLNAFFEYNKELTGYNQLFSWSKELPMPTITVCPQDIFKMLAMKQLLK